MKLSTLPTLILLLLLSFSCNKEDDMPDDSPSDILKLGFPQQYLYDAIDFKPSDFFVINGSGFTAISPTTEQLMLVDPFIMEELDEEDGLFFFSFREITLQSESLAIMKIVDEDTGESVTYPGIFLSNQWE